MRTPQKTAWRSNTIAEEPEEGDEEASGSGARPQALSASACQQVRRPPQRHPCMLGSGIPPCQGLMLCMLQSVSGPTPCGHDASSPLYSEALAGLLESRTSLQALTKLLWDVWQKAE